MLRDPAPPLRAHLASRGRSSLQSGANPQHRACCQEIGVRGGEEAGGEWRGREAEEAAEGKLHGVGEGEGLEGGSMLDPHVASLAYILGEPKACKFLAVKETCVACLPWVSRGVTDVHVLQGTALGLALDGTLHALPPASSHATRALHDSDSSDSGGDDVFSGRAAPAAHGAAAGGGSAEGAGADGEERSAEEGEHGEKQAVAAQEGAGLTLYIASKEQQALFGGARGPLGALILVLDHEALHASLVARLSRACQVCPLCRANFVVGIRVNRSKPQNPKPCGATHSMHTHSMHTH